MPPTIAPRPRAHGIVDLAAESARLGSCRGRRLLLDGARRLTLRAQREGIEAAPAATRVSLPRFAFMAAASYPTSAALQASRWRWATAPRTLVMSANSRFSGRTACSGSDAHPPLRKRRHVKRQPRIGGRSVPKGGWARSAAAPSAERTWSFDPAPGYLHWRGNRHARPKLSARRSLPLAKSRLAPGPTS